MGKRSRQLPATQAVYAPGSQLHPPGRSGNTRHTDSDTSSMDDSISMPHLMEPQFDTPIGSPIPIGVMPQPVQFLTSPPPMVHGFGFADGTDAPTGDKVSRRTVLLSALISVLMATAVFLTVYFLAYTGAGRVHMGSDVAIETSLCFEPLINSDAPLGSMQGNVKINCAAQGDTYIGGELIVGDSGTDFTLSRPYSTLDSSEAKAASTSILGTSSNYGGGDLSLTAGYGATGGDLVLEAGSTPSGTSTNGSILLGTDAASAVEIGNTASATHIVGDTISFTTGETSDASSLTKGTKGAKSTGGAAFSLSGSDGVSLTGDTSVDGDLNVSGAVVAATLTSTDAMDLSTDSGVLSLSSPDGISLSGPVSLDSTLHVAGDTTLDTALTVTGATTLSDSLTVVEDAAISKSATVGGSLTVSGATTLKDNLNVTKAATVGETLAVTGATTLKDT
ncbi:hypothetical protein KIPB_003429, partial [Kipferlia bialata]|eukprot:g3429.t1